MSPILDLQRRHAELFRIRLGELKLSAKGTKYPAALDGEIRVTTRSRAALDAIVATYGGTTAEWDQGGWEARLPTDHLRVVILPGDSVVEWWEQWRRKDGGMPVCTHRCDGFRNIQTGGDCSCPAVEERLADRERFCAPTTRLSIILPDVDVIGAGVLVSRGRIAAETLPQSVAVLRAALERGELIPATLRVVKIESSGKSFVVPRLEVVGVSLDQLLGGETKRALSEGEAPALGDGSPPNLSLGEGSAESAAPRPSPGACPVCGGTGIRKSPSGRTQGPCPACAMEKVGDR